MELKGFIFAVISAVFFGSAGIFIKHGISQNLSPVELLILQYIIAGTVLFFICLFNHRKSLRVPKKILIRLMVQGIIGNTLMTVFLYTSMAYLDVAIATMLLYMYPAMVALFSFLFLGEKISTIKTAAIVGTFTGCIMVLNIWTGHNMSLSTIGIVFGILSAVFYSFMNIYAERIVHEVPPIVITFYTTIFSLGILLIFNYTFLTKLTHISFDALINAGELAFFCEIVPLTLLYAAIKYIGPVKTAIISTLELPVSAVMAFIVMGESLLPTQITGIFLVLLSIIILKKE